MFLSVNVHICAQSSEHTVKSVLLMKIARYLRWPESEYDSNTTFDIGLIASPNIGHELKRVYANGHYKIRNKPVHVISFADTSEIQACDALYIGYTNSIELAAIVKKANQLHMLAVGDTPGYCQQGVHLNFYTEQGKIRFEINETALHANGFIINYRLRNIARVINPVERSGL